MLSVVVFSSFVAMSVIAVVSFVAMTVVVVVAFVVMVVLVVVAFVAMSVVVVFSFVAMAVAIRFLVQKSGVVFAELRRFLVFLVEKSGEAKRTANNVTDDEEDEVFLLKKSGEAKRTANNDAIFKSSSPTPKAAPAVQPPTAKELERNQAVDYVLAHPKDEWFRVLGVDGSVDDKMLTKHYREKSKLCHSDKHVGPHAHPRAKRAQQIVNEAYEKLSKWTVEERKQKYASTQRSGNASSRPAGASASSNGNASSRPSAAKSSSSTGNNTSRDKAKEQQQETPFARSSWNKNNFRRSAGTYTSSTNRSGTEAKTKPAKKAKPTKGPKPTKWPTFPTAKDRDEAKIKAEAALKKKQDEEKEAAAAAAKVLAVAKAKKEEAAAKEQKWFEAQRAKAVAQQLAAEHQQQQADAAATLARDVAKLKQQEAANKKKKQIQQEDSFRREARAKARKQQFVNHYEQPPLAAEVSDDDSSPASSDDAMETMAHHQTRLQQNRSGRRTRLPAPEHRRHTRGVIDDDSVLGSAYVDGRRQSRRCLELKPLGTIKLECGTRRSARIRAGRNS